jgi:hypothetical protein
MKTVEIDYYTEGKGNSKFKAGRKETTGKRVKGKTDPG